MTEIQKLNATPLSKAIKSIMFPYHLEETSPHLFQWLRLTISKMEAENAETELSPEELANLEALTFSQESMELYQQLTGAINPVYEQEELLLQVQKIEESGTEAELIELEVTLLEMMAANAANCGAELTPSLHEADR